MIHVACPWCDGTMTVADDCPEVECDPCGILVEIAPDAAAAPELAAAA